MPALDHEPLTWRQDVYGVPTLFRYEGGSYVDVCPLGEPVHAINVWDHAKGRSTVRSRKELRAVCLEWMEDLDRRDWRHGYCWQLMPCDCPACRRRSA